MGIRFLCANCNERLNVKDHQAGQQGVCPKCNFDIVVPPESTVPAQIRKKKKKRAAKSTAEKSQILKSDESFLLDKPAVNPGRASEVDPIDSAPKKVWYIRHPKHSEKGPVKGKFLRSMLNAGEIRPGSIVWREDWEDWEPVESVFPQVESIAKPPVATKSVFSDPNYEIGGAMNPAFVEARRKRNKMIGFVVAIIVGLVTIAVLIALLINLL